MLEDTFSFTVSLSWGPGTGGIHGFPFAGSFPWTHQSCAREGQENVEDGCELVSRVNLPPLYTKPVVLVS